MAISGPIRAAMAQGSLIREMFEEGNRLKARFGADQVYDFSLGNPDLEPPAAFIEALRRAVADDPPGCHGYMTNAGFPETRAAVAAHLGRESGLPLTADHVVMTSGAAGGLNVAFRSLLDPGAEVLVPAPYFPEYGPYVAYHGGVLRPVPTGPDFDLDVDALARAVTPRTQAVLINSPNNPTGRVYSAERLAALAAALDERSAAFQRDIYLLSDEPYRYLVYPAGLRVAPSPLCSYRRTIVALSHSKDLSVPGERIGALVIHPQCPDAAEVFQAFAYCTRTLGFVSANALMQRVVAAVQGVTVDVDRYRSRRDRLCGALGEFGYAVTPPDGAFYLWVRSPDPDDRAFCRRLAADRVLVVPGSGFGGPGYFRMAYCVSDATIRGSFAAFRAHAPRGGAPV